ncbi:hypothetical protein HN011_005760, partial [Eciton burchellii]
MAFDRTERFAKLIITTPTHVGPGTYDVSDLTKPPRDLAVPAGRHTAYQKTRISFRVPGGISINYTDVRFKPCMDVRERLNQARYVLPDDLRETPRRIRSRPGSCACQSPAGKLWLIRPPRSIVQTGPAVPTKRDFGGYTYDEYGILVKCPIIESEPTDFYDVPREEANFITLRYKGNFWSRMKGSRDDRRTFEGPGPGYYDHETKKTAAQICDEKIREGKRGAAMQPRFLDVLCRQKLRERFEDKLYTSKTPGPQTYDITFPQLCYGSILNTPFGVCSTRFKKTTDTETPAPGHYHTDVGNLAYESAKRFKDKISVYLDLPLMSDIMSPEVECTLTDERKITNEAKSAVYHAVFKSRVDRFPKILKDDDGLDPGAYEVSSAFKANRDKCDFFCQRLAPPFGSRASRFPKKPEKVDFHIPGPSDYDLRGDISKNVKSGVICYPRKARREFRGPGPSHYHIHQYLMSSVLKRSFNVTLGKSEITPRKTS